MMKRRTLTGLAAVCGAAVVSAGMTAQAQHTAETKPANPPAPTSQTQQGTQQKGKANQTGQMKDQPSMKKPAANVAGQKSTIMTLVTSADRLASSPDAFYGLPVSVHARVGEVKSANSFTLDDNTWLSGPDILVLIPKPQPGATLGRSDYVTVTGQLRRFVRAELERDYDWFGGIPDLNVDFESRPVLVADVVRTSDGTELAVDDQKITRIFVASPGEIADTPGRFYGRSVSVQGDVEDVKSQRMFTLDEDKLFAGPDVLVLNPFPAFAVGDHETVAVVGIVRPFAVAEFERDYDWFNATDYGVALEQFERRPVIVAHSILARGNREVVRVVSGFTLESSEQALAKRAQGSTRQ